MKKSGQIQITFNWVYILIAGAVILLFFAGLVIKQKAVSEQNLATDVVSILDSIFTSAGVSSQTKVFLDTSGLSSYTLFFNCQDRVGELGIKGQGQSIQNAIDPIFAPAEVQTTGLILWSLPYNFPYKVIDFLYIIPANAKYYLLGADNDFIREFTNSTADESPRLNINTEFISSLNEVKATSGILLRLVDLQGNLIVSGPVPTNLIDSSATAVTFTAGGINFYQENKGQWVLSNQDGPLPLISLGGERDAAKYGAIFSSDADNYWCNMQKAFHRLQYVTEVYSGKEEEINDFYTESGGVCKVLLSSQDNLRSSLLTLQTQAQSCRYAYSCIDMIKTATRIKTLDNQLWESHCIRLY